jgi:beta-lactamase class A
MTLVPQQELESLAATFDGRFGIYLEDLTTGAVAAVNADKRYPTASVCKVPVMVELFRQDRAGELSLADRQRFAGAFSTHGSGILSLTRDEPELSLLDYCRLMIAVSDNLATDLLMGVVGLDNVNRTMTDLGFGDLRTNSTIGRYHYAMVGMADEPPSPQADEEMLRRSQAGKRDYGSWPYHDEPDNNVASPAHMAGLLKAMLGGNLVDGEASAQMIDLLRTGRDRRMLPRYVKADVPVAHKYGSSGRIKGDVGILYLPSGPLVAAGFATAHSDEADGADVIARAVRLAVAALAPQSLEETDP